MSKPVPRPPRRIKIDPSLVARATREQRAPVTAHVADRPPALRGQIAYSFFTHGLPPRRVEEPE